MRWNDKFMNKCKEISENSDNKFRINLVPKLLQTYVDDMKNIVEELPPGAEYDGIDKTIKINKDKIDHDMKIPSDKRTFLILKEIANEIDPDIQMTIEVPSDNIDGKLPYLDTKIWLNYEDENFPRGKILSKHYRKPETAKVGIQIETAISARNQRTANTQELIRVLRNCSKDLHDEELNECLNDSMKQLQNSGYDKEYRKQILIAATKGFEKQKNADKQGIRTLYRPKGYNKIEQKEDKAGRMV